MRRIAKLILILLPLATLGARAQGQGVILWDESVNGELSQYYSTATRLPALLVGTNSIIGSTEGFPVGNNWFHQDDYFIVNVPDNLALTAVYLAIDTSNVWAWIGDPSYSSQMAWARNPASGELLSQWGLRSVAPGLYGMYMANLDTGPIESIANYRLDFVTQPAPEPATVVLWPFGAALLGLRLLGKPKAPRR